MVNVATAACHVGLQVQRLQQELGDTHNADYNTLKRAYVTLVQHFRALQVEAQASCLSPMLRNAVTFASGLQMQTLDLACILGSALTFICMQLSESGTPGGRLQVLKAHINALDVEVMSPNDVANEVIGLSA